MLIFLGRLWQGGGHSDLGSSLTLRVRSLQVAVAATVVFGVAPFTTTCQELQSNNPPAIQSTGTISGRTLVEGKPATGVRLFLVPADNSGAKDAIASQGISNEEGAFRITSVPAGTFFLTTEPSAYILTNNDRGGFPGRMVTIRGGEEVAHVDVVLEKGAVLTGRVYDADGEPLIGERVAVQRQTDRGQERPVTLSNLSGETDDRGVYRIYGLSVGKYILSVSRSDRPGMRSALALPTTYYPGVTDQSQAKLIELKNGDELKGLDIQLAESVEMHSAIGRVIDADTGDPVPDIRVSCSPVTVVRDRSNPVPNPETTTNSNGEFRLDNLKAGQYVAFGLPASGNQFYGDPATFQIAGTDAEGISIRVMRGSSISGSVTIVGDPSDSSISGRLTEVSVIAVDADKSNDMAGRQFPTAVLGTDGSFSITGVRPGAVRLVIPAGASREFSLLRVELNGSDKTSGIQITSGVPVTGVNLVLAYGTGSLVGRVTTKDADPALNSRLRVVLTPVSGSTQKRSSVALDAKGTFTMSNLPVGDYQLEVVERRTPGTRPYFLPAKQVITIKAGVNTEAIVPLELAGR